MTCKLATKTSNMKREWRLVFCDWNCNGFRRHFLVQMSRSTPLLVIFRQNKQRMISSLKMEEINTSPVPVFFDSGYFQCSSVEWGGKFCVGYHMYLTLEVLVLNEAIFLKLGNELSFDTTPDEDIGEWTRGGYGKTWEITKLKVAYRENRYRSWWRFNYSKLSIFWFFYIFLSNYCYEKPNDVTFCTLPPFLAPIKGRKICVEKLLLPFVV